MGGRPSRRATAQAATWHPCTVADECVAMEPRPGSVRTPARIGADQDGVGGYTRLRGVGASLTVHPTARITHISPKLRGLRVGTSCLTRHASLPLARGC